MMTQRTTHTTQDHSITECTTDLTDGSHSFVKSSVYTLDPPNTTPFGNTSRNMLIKSLRCKTFTKSSERADSNTNITSVPTCSLSASQLTTQNPQRRIALSLLKNTSTLILDTSSACGTPQISAFSSPTPGSSNKASTSLDISNISRTLKHSFASADVTNTLKCL